MKCLFMKRGGGKTTALVCTSASTNCPIVATTTANKRYALDVATRLGLTIPEPIVISENLRGMRFPNGVLIDDAEAVIKAWAKEHFDTDVVACAMSLGDTSECAQNKYSIGDRVVVYHNTERVDHNSFIGKKGTIAGYRSKDAVVKFDNDSATHFIYENDLRLEQETDCETASLALVYMRNGKRTVFPVSNIESALKLASCIADSDALNDDISCNTFDLRQYDCVNGSVGDSWVSYNGQTFEDVLIRTRI